MKYLRIFVFAAVGCCSLAACADTAGDPRDFYKRLVEAARTHDGGFMYDVLDSSRRAEVDTLMGLQMANLDKLPPSERPRWDSLKGKPKREIYARILGSDEGVAALFKGEYVIKRVDTLIVLTVQHSGQPENIMYLRPNGAGYVVSQAPRRPEPQPQEPPPSASPESGPGPQQGAPQGTPGTAKSPRPTGRTGGR